MLKKFILVLFLVSFSSLFAQSIIIKSSFIYGSRVYWGWHNGPIYNYSHFGLGHGFNNYVSFDKYAAISYSPSRNYYGYAWGKRSQSSAFFSASQECASFDCKDLVWVRNGCAATAALNDGTHLGWAYHRYKSYAMEYALKACASSQKKTEGCEVQAWVCSN